MGLRNNDILVIGASKNSGSMLPSVDYSKYITIKEVISFLVSYDWKLIADDKYGKSYEHSYKKNLQVITITNKKKDFNWSVEGVIYNIAHQINKPVQYIEYLLTGKVFLR